jgi:hypothetical protein
VKASLERPRLKLLRAEKHLLDLEAEYKRFIGQDPQPLRVGSYVDADDGSFVVLAQRRADVSDEFRFIVCDIVHNVRAALDYLAHELVYANGQVPTAHTAFPIYAALNAPSFANIRPLEGMSVHVKQAIEDLQPYKRANRAKDEPLSILHELSLIEKHRTIPMTAQMVNFRLGYPDEIKPTFQAFGDGTSLIRFPPGSKSKVDFDPSVTAKIIFSVPGESFDNASVRETLRHLYETVGNHVIPGFARFIP